MSMTGNNTAFLRWDPQVTSPFATLSRKVYPRTMREIFSWAEELWLHHGVYSGSIQKAIRHFLTGIQVSSKADDVPYDTAEKYRDVLTKDLKILQACGEVGDEFFAFGNCFTSMYRPFIRYLYCPQCGMSAPLRKMHDHYKWSGDGTFSGSCPVPHCQYNGAFNTKDIVDPDRQPSIKRWPAQFMQVKEHPISGRKQLGIDFSRYDQLYVGVTTGDPLYLEETPMSMIKAIMRKQTFQFKENEIYHLANTSLSTFHPNLKGWGLPPFMADFELVLIIYMLDKYTEAFLTDYLVPFRLLTPGGANGSADEGNPLLNMNMGDFVSQIKAMLARHRKNPTDWNFTPYPLQYQVLGGEAKNLVPIEIQEHFERRLLYIMGIPSYLTSPEGDSNANPLLGYKMFTRSWSHFVSVLNDWLTWVGNKRGSIQNWEAVDVTLLHQDVEEDPQMIQTKLDLASNNVGSKEDAYRGIGWDWKEQIKKSMDEQDWLDKIIAKKTEDTENEQANKDVLKQPSAGMVIAQQEQAAMEQQQAAQGGMPMPAGGATPGGMAMPMPAGGGQQSSATIEDLLANADQFAQQMLVMDPLSRDRQLASMKASDEALYAQTKARLQQLEQQAKQQGLVMARSGQLPLQPQQ